MGCLYHSRPKLHRVGEKAGEAGRFLLFDLFDILGLERTFPMERSIPLLIPAPCVFRPGKLDTGGYSHVLQQLVQLPRISHPP